MPHLRSLGGFSSLTTVFIGQLYVCAALLNCTRWSQFKSGMDAEGSAQAFLCKARSDVWAQFTRKKDVARCNLCGKEYKYTLSTSNSQKHLRTANPYVWKEMDHDTLKTKPITSWVVSKGNSQSCSPAKAKSITELIVDWVTTSGRPLSIVNDPDSCTVSCTAWQGL